MVLVGRVNKQIVNGLQLVGARAVGLAGCDGGLVRARCFGDGSLGLVGDVAGVDPSVLTPLLDAGYLPVISSVAPDRNGQAHNINADTVAGELAAALQAEKLVLLTDTPGILRDREDPASLIRHLGLAQGVRAAHIVDGRVPQSLLLEVFTDAGIGTMLSGSPRVPG